MSGRVFRLGRGGDRSLIALVLLALGLATPGLAAQDPAASQPETPASRLVTRPLALPPFIADSALLPQTEFDALTRRRAAAAALAMGEQAAPAFCCDKRHFALAGAEVMIVQLIPWYFNRHIKDDSIAVLSLDSFKRNIEQGFEWDVDAFSTNLFSHPFHGNLYFNSARTNGYSFWESAAFAWTGSFIWEFFGENNRPAINDWASTSVGGTVIGEALYRTSKVVLDNTDTGVSRTFRELGNLLFNPVAGFNRIFRGEATRVGPNPPDRLPSRSVSVTRLGGRIVNDADTGTDGKPFFDLAFQYGDPFEPIEKPLDAFQLMLQLNGSDKKVLGRIQVEGALWATDLKRSETVHHVFGISQHYDYANNEAFEIGGQSFSATFLSRFALSDEWTLRTKLQPTVSLIWGVDSEYAAETGRDYDMGTGAGLRTFFTFSKGASDVVQLSYQGNWSRTLNGSRGSHAVHFPAISVKWPFFGSYGLGAEFIYMARNSFYHDFENVHRQNPQFRVYVVSFD